MSDEVKIAPLQLLAVAFDDPKFKGQIASELKKLRDSKMIRVVDSAIVNKDDKGKIDVRQESDLSMEEAGMYGAVIGGLIGVGSGDADIAEARADEMAESFEQRYEFGLDKEDVSDLAANLPNKSAVLVLLIEHLWALPLRDAFRKAGGMLLSQDFLSPELLIGIGRREYAQPA